MLPVIQIGPLSIPTVPFLWFIGFWLFAETSEKVARASSLDAKVVGTLIYQAGGIGLIGARLGYLFQYPLIFLATPLSIVSPRPNLFSLEGGILFGVLGLVVLAQKKKIALLKLLDVLSPGLAFWMAMIGLAWQAGGENPGIPANIFWGIPFLGEIRHPVNLYWSLGFMIIGFYALKTSHQVDEPGDIGLGLIVLGALVFIITSLFRVDGFIEEYNWKRAASLMFLCLASLAVYLRSRKPRGDMVSPS
jgi:prolipoprotein diacylglyceryltransferase